MLWIKSFHIIFVITWFAGLFYLPRLFVYHAMSSDEVSLERFKIMERKLFWGIMTPSGIFATILGITLLIMEWPVLKTAGWIHAKLSLVFILWVYHFYCGKFLFYFSKNKNTKSHVFYRWFNEFPVVLLIAIVILVVVRPF